MVRLKALAVTTRRRSPVLPEVPTVSESGLAGYEVAPWWGVLAPAATPRAVISKLHADIGDVLKLEFLKAPNPSAILPSSFPRH